MCRYFQVGELLPQRAPLTVRPAQQNVLAHYHVFAPRHHLYSLHSNHKYGAEMLHRPCFLAADTKEAITVRRGQIGWGSYLGRIMFDILHHYQLPLFSSSGVISLPC